MISIIPIVGIGKINPGDNLADLFAPKLSRFKPFLDSDCIVVASKVISKSRGQIFEYKSEHEKHAIIESESVRVLRRRNNLIISETKHGYICANAGVGVSNTEEGTLVLLPKDLDGAANALQKSLLGQHKIDTSVIISGAFSRPFRKGKTNVALGIAGLKALATMQGTKDFYGREVQSSPIAIADEIAGAAELAMHKSAGNCLVLVRGLPSSYRGKGKGSDIVRKQSEDLFG